jgi:homoaconitase/3-isopropylmalate dehydratase large subunit
VPRTMKIMITGTPGTRIYAKDIILHILKHIGTDGALNRASEFSGDTVQNMDLAGRITLASMVTEMSGDIGFVEPDKGIIQYIQTRTSAAVEELTRTRYMRRCLHSQQRT